MSEAHRHDTASRPPLRIVEPEDVATLMARLGREARAASRTLALASTEVKNTALHAAARQLRACMDDILAANAEDAASARDKGLTRASIDRLTLDPDRVEAIAKALEDIAGLADPVGETIAAWGRPNGLAISRVRTPLGVVGVIFESRPNVMADAGALCVKAGNAAILRPGSDSARTSAAIHACLTDGLAEAGLPETAIQRVPTTDRAAVGEMLRGLDGNIDVIVPRGGRGLVERVQAEARVPVFAHLEGLVHLYVSRAADLDKARAIVVNAKMRRTGICGALETLLVDGAAPETLRACVTDLLDAGCEVRGDEAVRAVDPRVVPATDADWDTEYLDAIVSVRTVAGLDQALAHIARHSSSHTDGILTEDDAEAARFLTEVDSAIVLHNASTQFADGGEFGMGAEIGIATGRMHARGPVGVEQLTSFKYQVRGAGQTRP